MNRCTALMLASAWLLAPGAARAERLTVMELFTSQGCSSCPPADALLAEAVKDPSLLPLGMHVTYWDRLGWKDPYALAAATQRQRDASARLGLTYVYTPQVVVDGRAQAVGSNRAEVAGAVAAARAAADGVDLALSEAEGRVRVAAPAGAGRGRVLLVGFDREHLTPVRAGENGGRTLREVNVVRSVSPIGEWTGAAVTLEAVRPSGERVAALLQAEDGRILGAALLR